MKKVLLSGILWGVLASVFISGCSSTPEEKLQDLQQELRGLGKKESDCGFDMNCLKNINDKRKELKDKIRELKQEFMKKQDPEVINNKFFEALKNNNIDEALKYCYLGENNVFEEKTKDKLQKMKDKLDLSKTESLGKTNKPYMNVFKYRFFYKDGRKVDVEFNMDFTDNLKYEFDIANYAHFNEGPFKFF